MSTPLSAATGKIRRTRDQVKSLVHSPSLASTADAITDDPTQKHVSTGSMADRRSEDASRRTSDDRRSTSDSGRLKRLLPSKLKSRRKSSAADGDGGTVDSPSDLGLLGGDGISSHSGPISRQSSIGSSSKAASVNSSLMTDDEGNQPR